MKIFTKSVLVAIAMMAGVTTASAQDEWMDPDTWTPVVKTMWNQWSNPDDPSTCTKEATAVGTCSPTWNLDTPIGPGACILGAENVTWNLYADISEYDKLILFGASTAQTRVMCNRTKDEGAWKNLLVMFDSTDPHWNEDFGCLVIDLSEIKNMPVETNGDQDGYGVPKGSERIDDFVHFHCIKNPWFGDNSATVSDIYVWKFNDPTGIKNVKANVEDGAYYNLAGQKVADPKKGVFIHNGKKIVMK